ncbi:MAG: IPT/TIG domain-containing protein [Thermoanaerobaculia bacterium]|nr:IPT/TIG domain-containing protein [Thermoanaerobaculia bacterium]
MTMARLGTTVALILLALGCGEPLAAQVELQYLYDDAGQLVKVADSEGNVVDYVYDLAGNLIEVRRTTVGNLALFDVSPRSGPVGTSLEITGRGFSPVPTENTVRVGGALAPVILATGTRLVVEVPVDAVTGPVEVTVDGLTVASATAFTVLTPPRVLALAPDVAGADPTAAIPFTMTVTGERLTGATFRFLPTFVPAAVAVTSASVAPDGASATLGLSLAPGVVGSFVLEVQGPAGRSSALPRPGNTLEVLPGEGDLDLDGLVNSQETTRGTDLRRRDTDGDGINDRDEVTGGSNPRDPASLPAALFGFAASSFHLLNRAAPDGAFWDAGFAVLNGASAEATVGQFFGPGVTVLNQLDPQAAAGFTLGPSFAVANELDPAASQGFAFAWGPAVENLFVP